ncbi:MAG: LPP20 family lipoprotein [Gammaproteobacteria bacterium]
MTDPLAPPEQIVKLKVGSKVWHRPSARSVARGTRVTEKIDVTVATVRPLEEPTPVALESLTDITATGFASITAQSGGDAAQRRLQAARAAKLDAYRNLAEQLYGVEFASDSVVADTRVREDHIRVRISGVIAGAELVLLEPLGNDSYQATVKLPASKVAALLQR